jgi:hypothetical protein
MIYRLVIAAVFTLVGCASSPSVPSPRFYEYWQSAPDGVGTMGVPTNYYTKLFTTRGPRRQFFNDTEKDFYDAARGDAPALHRFFASSDRDADGAPGQGWSADMVVLTLIYGDQGLYVALRDQPQSVREEVGATIEQLMPRDRDTFRQTRTLYKFRSRPRPNQTMQLTAGR